MIKAERLDKPKTLLCLNIRTFNTGAVVFNSSLIKPIKPNRPVNAATTANGCGRRDNPYIRSKREITYQKAPFQSKGVVAGDRKSVV